MTKICRICGKEFEPKVHNATICYRNHYTKCRICGKEISLDGDKNKLKRNMYLKKGFAYCSHLCSCRGIALDKQIKEEENVDLDKLKFYVEQTPLTYVDISKLLNVPVDFIHSRIKKYNLTRNEDLQKQSKLIINSNISKSLKNKYKDEDVKNEMIEKAKNTYKQRTGYTSNFLNPESVQRARQTKLKKYSDETFTNPQKMIETRKRNNNGKFWTQEQIQQGIETRKKLYGSVNNLEKLRHTYLKKYGVKWWTNPKKIKLTWNKKSKKEKQEIVQKQRKTCQERYKVNNPMQLKSVSNKVQQVILKRYGVTCVFKLPEVQEKIKQTNLKKYGTMYPVTLFSHLNGITISKINKKVNQLLLNLGCETQLEKRVNNMSYDILVKPNTLIEINPTYTHNSTIGPFMFGKRVNPKDKNYHLIKTNNATEHNYRCIHIFDWDDIDKIINSLQQKQLIYARKCIIKEVSLKECKKFLDNYHFQNSCNNQIIRLGLYYNNELVQVMTFGYPRYNKNYEWELLRLCTLPKYKIVGGTEKLFKHFLKTQNPKNIISYCDNSKFSGEVYTKLGFTFKSLSSPSKHWYNSRTKRHITDNLLRQRGFSQLHNDNNYKRYNKGDNNEKLMIDNGYVVIYGCGQTTYIWNK